MGEILIVKRPVMGFENYGAPNTESIVSAIKIMELTSALLAVFYSAVLIYALIFI